MTLLHNTTALGGLGGLDGSMVWYSVLFSVLFLFVHSASSVSFSSSFFTFLLFQLLLLFALFSILCFFNQIPPR